MQQKHIINKLSLNLTITLYSPKRRVFFPSRAIFYCKNVHAATTKHHAASKANVQPPPSAVTAAISFPELGWSTNRKDLPVVSALTILGHLLKTGKANPDRNNVGEVRVVQKPLTRGKDFFPWICTRRLCCTTNWLFLLEVKVLGFSKRGNKI